MPFTDVDFHALIRLLEAHPEWRTELRRLVLTDELLSLPEQIAALRLRNEQQQHAWLEAQQRTEARLEALTARVETLVGRVEALAAAQQRTEEQMTVLAQVVQTLTNDMGELKGHSLEANYRTKGPAYFGRIIRRSHVLTSDELIILVEDARERGLLSDADAQEIYEADVVVRGRRPADGAEVYLVVEVSWGVGLSDVERAARRAALLAHTGMTVLPVVAGKWVTPDASRMAHDTRV